MNVYDAINNLANEIKKSEQYIEYKKIREQIKQNPELEKKLQAFEKARYETQVTTLSGKEPKNEDVEEMKKTYLELIQNDITKKYLDVELAFNTMLTDINKILGEAVKDVMD